VEATLRLERVTLEVELQTESFSQHCQAAHAVLRNLVSHSRVGMSLQPTPRRRTNWPVTHQPVAGDPPPEADPGLTDLSTPHVVLAICRALLLIGLLPELMLAVPTPEGAAAAVHDMHGPQSAAGLSWAGFFSLVVSGLCNLDVWVFALLSNLLWGSCRSPSATAEHVAASRRKSVLQRLWSPDLHTLAGLSAVSAVWRLASVLLQLLLGAVQSRRAGEAAAAQVPLATGETASTSWPLLPLHPAVFLRTGKLEEGQSIPGTQLSPLVIVDVLIPTLLLLIAAAALSAIRAVGGSDAARLRAR
jgi:hypothetical protein